MSGMPSISITFTEVAATAIKRGERGIIATILKESTVPTDPVISCQSASDIPGTLTTANKKALALALKGYINTPKKVIAYIIPATVIPEGETDPVNNTDYSDALDYFKTIKFDYLFIPTVATDNKTSDIVSYVATERTNNKLIKAILPNTVADKEGIINFTTTKLYEGDTEYTTAEACARIAGIIAGTPINISCTYATIPEMTDCTRLTKAQMDAAVNAGQLIAWFDGEKVKLGRGVNSLTTLTSEKNTQFQKIKIVDAMDMIATDIRMTAEDNYLGKYANSYDNKCLLISAIGNYFDQLIMDDVLQSATIEIDIDGNRSYLKGKGVDVDKMTDQEIKEANTGSYVFLKATLSILDAIEDIVLPITI